MKGAFHGVLSFSLVVMITGSVCAPSGFATVDGESSREHGADFGQAELAESLNTDSTGGQEGNATATPTPTPMQTHIPTPSPETQQEENSLEEIESADSAATSFSLVTTSRTAHTAAIRMGI